MQTLQQRLAALDWTNIENNLHDRGYCHIKALLSPEACAALVAENGQPDSITSSTPLGMATYGLGEYRYLPHPLPDALKTIREEMYFRLAPIANQWLAPGQVEDEWPLREPYPATLSEFLSEFPTTETITGVLVHRYDRGSHHCLHHYLHPNAFFPLKGILFLSEPDVDFTGGEFVISSEHSGYPANIRVLKPRRGDMVVLTTFSRPVWRDKEVVFITIADGISELQDGTQHTVTILLHDCPMPAEIDPEMFSPDIQVEAHLKIPSAGATQR
jgi:uncharacterized protein